MAILPYSRVVGQDDLKLALELNFIAPGIGGVLIAGQRGTAKSTVVRAFALMTGDRLPVTLPINATDDRVLGGWQLDALMRGDAKRQPGLLEEAHEKGLLYVDEVNLLDDHIVNIILDVASTGVLSVQREGIDTRSHVSFGLVGTMNPEEGSLRAQLLDRFGLMVAPAELGIEERHLMITTVLTFEEERLVPDSDWIRSAEEDNRQLREELLAARDRLPAVRLDTDISRLCAQAAARTKAVGQRGDLVMAKAARALAAREGTQSVEPGQVRRVLPFALRHRRPDSVHGSEPAWGRTRKPLSTSCSAESRMSGRPVQTQDPGEGDDDSLRLLAALVCSALEPSLTGVLLFDCPPQHLASVREAFAQVLGRAAGHPSGLTVPQTVLDAATVDEDLWVRPRAHRGPGGIEFTFGPGPLAGTGKGPQVVVVPDLARLSVPGMRAAVQLLGADTATLEHSGIRNRWRPHARWLACCRSEDAELIPPHLLDRFPVRLAVPGLQPRPGPDPSAACPRNGPPHSTRRPRAPASRSPTRSPPRCCNTWRTTRATGTAVRSPWPGSPAPWPGWTAAHPSAARSGAPQPTSAGPPG